MAKYFCNDIARTVYPFMDGSRGGGGGGTGGLNPPKNHKIYGFLATLVRIPWKIIKLPLQARFNVGPSSARQRNAVPMTGQ